MPKAESKGSKSGAMFRELFDRVPIGLYRTTPNGKIVDVNPALAEMLGFSDKKALLAEVAHTVYAHAETRGQWLAEMDAKGTVSGFEAEWR